MIVEQLSDLLQGNGAVAAIFSDRIYPVQAPDAPDYHYAVITKVAGAPEYDIQGPAMLENSRIQIDVFGKDGMAALILAKNAIKEVMSGFHGAVESGGDCVIQSCFCINDFDLSETSTERAGPRVKRRVLEFSIWTRET